MAPASFNDEHKAHNVPEHVPNKTICGPYLDVDPCLKPKCLYLLCSYLRFVKLLTNFALMYVDLPKQYPDDEDKPQNQNEAQRLSCYLCLTMYVDLPMQAPDNTKIIKHGP